MEDVQSSVAGAEVSISSVGGGGVFNGWSMSIGVRMALLFRDVGLRFLDEFPVADETPGVTNSRGEQLSTLDPLLLDERNVFFNKVVAAFFLTTLQSCPTFVFAAVAVASRTEESVGVMAENKEKKKQKKFLKYFFLNSLIPGLDLLHL